MADPSQAFRSALAGRLGVEPSRIALCWKGRVALHALLRAMGIAPGDEVILPAYTCVAVPNAVIYCGAVPVYADIDLDTFCPDLEAIAMKLTPRTRVIVCQNTYGLSAQVDAIARFARDRNLRTIEDCTHGFGATFHGRPNGSLCDAAFFSTQWNKPLSTGIGGFALVNDPGLTGPLEREWAGLAEPGFMDVLSLGGLYLCHDWLLNGWTHRPLVAAYRSLAGLGLVLGSSAPDETRTSRMPRGYRKQMAAIQCRRGLGALAGFDRLQALRKSNAAMLTAFLAGHGKNHVRPQHFPDHGFCRYPLLVHDRAAFREKARAARILLGDWFISPLHPVDRDLQRWRFDPAACPRAVHAARHVVNLPVAQTGMTEVLRFLDSNLEQIAAAARPGDRPC